jgi:hypothetical protein
MHFHTTCFVVPMRPAQIASVLFSTILTAFAQSATAGEPPPAAVVERLSEVIRRHCPEVRISADKEKFVAKHATMIFTLHNRSKTGEISQHTYQAEGPNHKGFIVTVWRDEGPYEGAAVMPQTMEEPYYSTFIDAVPTEDRRGHLRVGFSYGRRIDENLKQAIRAALPKTTSVARPD